MADSGSNGPTPKKSGKSGKEVNVTAEKEEIKILMLHGYAQNGPLFRSKTGAMSKMMAKALPTFNATRIYPTGPHKLQPSDIPGFQPREGADESDAELDAYGWFLHDEEPGLLRGFEEGMRSIANAIEDAGGVDGVLGFSQGGAIGALVAAALEGDRELPENEMHRGWVKRLREANGGRSLRFCIVYSGFVTRPGAQLGWLYEGQIKTPSCHFFGSGDTVVEEPRCRDLAERFVDPNVMVHPGGHHVPVRKEWVAPLLGFLKSVLEKDQDAATA
ncbi:Family of serine hydrolases 3 [Gnomoniopsis sp. IMI 355080]|nr:Family of serine hydrolases 3 [Gnomoniopsis sp. IMI 355080]